MSMIVFFVAFVALLISSAFILNTYGHDDLKLKMPTFIGSITTLLAFFLLPLLTFALPDQINQNVINLPEAEFAGETLYMVGLTEATGGEAISEILFVGELAELWRIAQIDQYVTSWDLLSSVPVFDTIFYIVVAWHLVVACLALMGLIVVILTQNPVLDKVVTCMYGISSAMGLFGLLWYLPLIDNLGVKEDFLLSLLMVLAEGKVGVGVWFMLLGNLLLAFNMILQGGVGDQGLGFVGSPELEVFDQNEVSSSLPSAVVTLVAVVLLGVTLMTITVRLFESQPTTTETLLTPQPIITRQSVDPQLITPTDEILITVTPTSASTTIPAPLPTSPPTSFATSTTSTPTPIASVISPQPSPTVDVSQTVIEPPGLETLQELMLGEINQARSEANARPVIWDELAAMAGTAHARNMAHQEFFSHWNPQGQGPDHRYSQLGGRDVVAENIHLAVRTYDDGRPAPIPDWSKQVITAQLSLMNSPGHRRTILNPAHTHVGIGLAYNQETGKFYVAQEFISRYVQLQPLPFEAKVGRTISLKGLVLPGSGASQPLINLAYEPFPQPISFSDLAETNTYASAAEFFQAITPTMLDEQRFEAEVVLNHEGRPGLYHVRIFVDHPDFIDRIQASNVIIEVR